MLRYLPLPWTFTHTWCYAAPTPRRRPSHRQAQVLGEGVHWALFVKKTQELARNTQRSTCWFMNGSAYRVKTSISCCDTVWGMIEEAAAFAALADQCQCLRASSLRLSSSLQKSLFEQDSQKKQCLATCDFCSIRRETKRHSTRHQLCTLALQWQLFRVVPIPSPPTGPKRLLFSIPLVSTLSVLSTLA